MIKLKNIIPDVFYRRYLKPLQVNFFQSSGQRIYSQEGEDILVERMIGKKKNGFYIDIGAHHPYRFSNTYYFYKQGWSGLNVEPNPELFNQFVKHRKRDINLNIGLSSKPQELKYYYFEEPAMNTFSSAAVEHILNGGHKLVRTEMIHTTTLALALKDHRLPKDIDFMTIDAEGLDFDIIQSNDWERINPSLILIESGAVTLQDVLETALTKYLNGKNYSAIAKLHNTVIYLKNL